jgi:cytochrome c-type biogenesis protein
MADISSIAAALAAGVLSFLSPCVLPLVPPYLVYLAGASIERLAGKEPERLVRGDAVLAAALFVAGFSTIFVALGATASAVGRLLHAWSNELSIVAGVAIIIMGLHFLGVIRLAVLMLERRAPMSRPVGLWGAYVMGLAFAFGWTPCIGPVLSTILGVAASKETVAEGAGLLAVYSAGLGVPFIAAALFVEPVTALLSRFKRHMAIIEMAMGGLLVLTGIAFIAASVTTFNFFTWLGTYLIEWFPALGQIG